MAWRLLWTGCNTAKESKIYQQPRQIRAKKQLPRDEDGREPKLVTTTFDSNVLYLIRFEPHATVEQFSRGRPIIYCNAKRYIDDVFLFYRIIGFFSIWPVRLFLHCIYSRAHSGIQVGRMLGFGLVDAEERVRPESIVLEQWTSLSIFPLGLQYTTTFRPFFLCV